MKGDRQGGGERTPPKLGVESSGVLLHVGIEPRELGRGAALRFVGMKVREVRAESSHEIRLPPLCPRRADPHASQGVGDQVNWDAASRSDRESSGRLVVQRVAVQVDVLAESRGRDDG